MLNISFGQTSPLLSAGLARKTERIMDVIITGAGIGGLTLGLRLHQLGIPCRIYEAAPELKALGVGINLLPHANCGKELAELVDCSLRSNASASPPPKSRTTIAMASSSTC